MWRCNDCGITVKEYEKHYIETKHASYSNVDKIKHICPRCKNPTRLDGRKHIVNRFGNTKRWCKKCNWHEIRESDFEWA